MGKVIEHVDLVLFDVKHLDPQKHKETIGVENGMILRNLRNCSGLTEIWLRLPLIPGFNEAREHMDAVVQLGKEVGATRCYFLPFHRWGEHKYARLGLPNTYANFREFDPEEITRFKEWYMDQGDFVVFEKA